MTGIKNIKETQSELNDSATDEQALESTKMITQGAIETLEGAYIEYTPATVIKDGAVAVSSTIYSIKTDGINKWVLKKTFSLATGQLGKEVAGALSPANSTAASAWSNFTGLTAGNKLNNTLFS